MADMHRVALIGKHILLFTQKKQDELFLKISSILI